MESSKLPERRWIVLLVACIFTSLAHSASPDQFVELNAEIEINNWSYWFFEDVKDVASMRGMPPKSTFRSPETIHLVVGTNTWLMEGGFYRNANVTRWFTGTNIIEHSVIIAQIPNPPRIPNSPVMLSPPVGRENTRIRDTTDGNPGRPVRVADLMQLQGKISWLAFCSGAALKRAGRQIFPPDDLWKERCECSGIFNDRTVTFQDGLGLPKSIELFTQKGQLILQYQVRQSTNMKGWNIPLEFYLIQYGPAHLPRTNSWEVEFTARGRVTSIGLGTAPSLGKDH